MSAEVFLNEDYWQVLNNAIFRPLDYEYQRALSAGAQRFYELVSFAMFAAQSKRRDEAKLVYSDYCLRAPQYRYFTRAEVQKQMYKIHRPHVKAGYIEKLRYRQITDQDGKSDWEIFYTPGPRARAQYTFFKNRQKQEVFEISQMEHSISPMLPEAPTKAEPTFLDDLVKRGISSARAKKILSDLKSEDELYDLLEWGDYLVSTASGKIRNPAGFYIYLIQDRVLPPPTFETSRKRALREAAEREAKERETQEARYKLAYEEYQKRTVERYIEAHLRGDAYNEQFQEKRKATQKVFKSLHDKTVDEIAHQAIRRDLTEKGRITFMPFDEFCRSYDPDQLSFPTF